MFLNYLLSKLYIHKNFKEILKNLSKKQKEQKVIGLSILTKAYLLSALFEKEKKTILIITPTQNEAEELHQNLLLFTKNTFLFPSWEILPYEEQRPAEGLMGERIKILFKFLAKEQMIVVAFPRSISYKLIPPKELQTKKILIKKGEETNRDELIKILVSFGYEICEQVEEEGYFRAQGGIVDLYPPSEVPLRVEFFGDVIESIREFNISTQGSLRHLEEVLILARNESILCDCQGQKVSFFEYVPEEVLLVIDEWSRFYFEYKNLQKEIDDFYQERLLISKKIPSPAEIFIKIEDIKNILSRYYLIHTSLINNTEIKSSEIFFNIPFLVSYNGKISLLVEDLLNWQAKNYEVVVLVRSKLQEERILSSIEEEVALKEKIKIFIFEENVYLHGFLEEEIKLVVISEQEIWEKIKISKRRYKSTEKWVVKDYRELDIHDYVVHVNYGIGRYLGIKNIETQGIKRDYLVLEYDNNDKLYLPLDQMHLVEKYTGGENPPLYPLGGNLWNQVKKRVKESVQKVAKELLELYAYRKVLSGFSFSKDSKWQCELEESFIYQETEDQLKSLAEVKKDMESPFPMDRLVCGDVGYGKTEVAIRAAFKAVMNNKQVGILVPTTILAQQHYLTLRERFKNFPICVEILSRFKTQNEQKKIVEELKDGKIDIIIGTHRLLQKDVVFKDLGLLIIDEEQRFGVTHKEKMKRLHKEVDILTLTATPIPRTLYMSFVGIRDISVINTPPPERFPIRTLVTKFDQDIIKKAILREIDRGGQIYFVHNKVVTIKEIYNYLSSLIPEVKIVIAHGQMPGKDLENIMMKFIKKEYDLLLSTSIIESGLDIPSVNTIIINDAHEFGLSQLYQLRGRVGRTNHLAYAYLLYPSQKSLSKPSQERLKTIMECTELGCGFKIAMRDLEIRGTGNILGHRQHGNIVAVGFGLYCNLLSQEIAKIKGENISQEINPKIDLNIDAYIPESFISAPKIKQAMYKRMASIKKIEELGEYKEEFKDRFGKIPKVIDNLFKIIEMKIISKKIKVESVTIIEDEACLRFMEVDNKLVSKLVKLVENNNNLRLDPQGKNILRVLNVKNNLDLVKKILQELR